MQRGIFQTENWKKMASVFLSEVLNLKKKPFREAKIKVFGNFSQIFMKQFPLVLL